MAIITNVFPVRSIGIHPDNVACDVTVMCSDFPKGLPLTPNPRHQNSKLKLYKGVAASLRENPMFGYMNKGLVLLVKNFVNNGNGTVTVVFDTTNQAHGLVDGGNTYQVIVNEQNRVLKDGEKMAPNFVKMTIIDVSSVVGSLGLATKAADVAEIVHSSAIDIARGNNMTIQVREDSIADLDGYYDWIRACLKGDQSEDKIGYRQNSQGVKIRDVLALLAAVIAKDAPSKVRSYISKQGVFDDYVDSRAEFEAFSDILPDLLALSEDIGTVISNALDADVSRKFIAVMHNGFKPLKRGFHVFPFSGAKARFTMPKGYMFPLYGAISELVKMGKNGKMQWRLRTAEATLEVFKKTMNKILHVFEKANDVPDKIGKKIDNWTDILQIVKARVEAIEGKSVTVAD